MKQLLKYTLSVCACLFALTALAVAESPSDAKVKSLTSLAEQGDIVAQNNLARPYADGKIAPKDSKAVLFWLKKAASAGQPNAQTSLGWAYMSDYLGLAPDYQLAMKWNLKAANQDFGEGSANIGLLYEKGWGVPVNYVEAANWYKKAIDQGAKSGLAEMQLAGLYENGLGIQKNLNEAVKLRQIITTRNDLKQAKQINDQVYALDVQGKFQESITLGQRALAIRERVLGAEHADVAQSLFNLASPYAALEQYDKALPLLERALAINEKAFGPDHPNTGAILTSLGVLYDNIGLHDQALPLLQRALAINEKALGPDHEETAACLSILANLYFATGQYEKALPLYQRVLVIFERTRGNEHPYTALSLSNLGHLYQNIGQYDKAMPLFQRAHAINEKVLGPDHPRISLSLGGLAGMYIDLGQSDKALPLLQRELAIDEIALGSNHTMVATILIGLAQRYESLRQYDKALPLLERALSINEKALGPDHAATARSLTFLSLHYIAIGQRDKAIPIAQRALTIYEKTFGSNLSDLTHVSDYFPLISLSRILGQDVKELVLLQRTYRAAMTAGEPDTLMEVQGSLGTFYTHDNPATAIFYLKGAVNTTQSIRAQSRGLDKELQESLLKKNEDIYKMLADLLIDAGRLAEAQQVLTMLKEDEYFDFIRRDAQADTRSARMNYSDAERHFVEQLETMGNEGAALVGQLNELNGQAKLGLTPEQEQQRARIKAQLADQAKQTIALLNEIAQQLPATTKQRMADADKGAPGQFREMLTSLEHGAVLLSYIVTEKRVHILLNTPQALLVREAKITAKELNRKIAAFRRVLQNPARDPRPQAQALYQLLIAPVANDLKQANAKTLMLSLDGSLRYLPMGALHDGKAYLAERYPLAMYTEAAKDNLRTRPELQWKAAGLGITRKIGEFSPLPSVRQELEGIIVGSWKTGGALPGDIYLDEAFTQKRLHDVLDRAYPVLHIASHFVFIPGTEAQSFLLLGDGKQLSLAELRTGGWEFGSVDMMTLSACETALGGGHDENGREIEGFGALVQRQGAKGVLATLWPVADQSTAILMQSLYRLRQQKGLTKADALREAQLTLIAGKHSLQNVSRKAPIVSSAGTGSTDAPVYTIDLAHPYAHPYYWAPFILMGNWL